MTDLHPSTDLSDDPATQLPSAQPGRRDPERGFSLIELIIVIVIIGILAAIAIPVYNHIQDNAHENAVKAVAGNVASEVSAKVGSDDTGALTPETATVSDSVKSGADVTVTGSTIDSFCVTATKDGFWAKSGTATGCTGSGKGTAP